MNPAPIFFAHANGFPADCYQILFEQLKPYPISFIEEFGKNSIRPDSWKELGEEIITHLEQTQSGPVIGLGHSFGGVGVFFAARKRPDLFSRIILLDPPFFGWKRRWLVAPFQLIGLAEKVVPPAIKALQRKDQFASREEARTYFSQKRFFQTFHPQAFDDYLTHGLIEANGGVTLRVSKEKEARYFAVFPSRIGSTSLEVPGHYIIPEGQGIAPPSTLPELQKRFSRFQWDSVPGNHMFPLEYPAETARLLTTIIGT